MTINGKTAFLIGAAILAGLVIVQLKDVRIAIGERAWEVMTVRATRKRPPAPSEKQIRQPRVRGCGKRA